MTTIPVPRTLWFALALATVGCGSPSGSAAPSASRGLLRDVPELRGASGGYGSERRGGPTATDSAPPRSASSRGRGVGLPAAFDGTEMYSGRFGGPLSASSLSSGCPGWVAPQPNHVIDMAMRIPFAQFVVTSDPLDTTLVVQLPDGSFRCNDDTNGLNPVVALQPVPRGQLRVWVGAYQQGAEGDYQMAFTTDASHGDGEPVEEDASEEESESWDEGPMESPPSPPDGP